MHAGGSHERITLLPISSDSAADEEAGGGEGLKEAEEDGAALDAIWTKFADFDVEQAKCTKETLGRTIAVNGELQVCTKAGAFHRVASEDPRKELARIPASPCNPCVGL